MNIGEICAREVVLVDWSATLQQAARLMREHHVGMLIVTGESADDREVLGIVTDRDIVIEAVAHALDVTRAEVGRLIKDRLAALPASATIDEAVSRMKQHGVRRLLVADDAGHVQGVVSLDDVVRALGRGIAELTATEHEGIERETAESKPLPPPAGELQQLHIPDYAFA